MYNVMKLIPSNLEALVRPALFSSHNLMWALRMYAEYAMTGETAYLWWAYTEEGELAAGGIFPEEAVKAQPEKFNIVTQF